MGQIPEARRNLHALHHVHTVTFPPPYAFYFRVEYSHQSSGHS